MVLKPLVGGDLEQEVDIETPEGLDDGAAEEALVEAHGDLVDTGGSEPSDEVREPSLGAPAAV